MERGLDRRSMVVARGLVVWRHEVLGGHGDLPERTPDQQTAVSTNSECVEYDRAHFMQSGISLYRRKSGTKHGTGIRGHDLVPVALHYFNRRRMGNVFQA